MPLASPGTPTIGHESRVVAFMAPGQNIKEDAWKRSLRLLNEPGTEAIFQAVKMASSVDIVEVCNREEPLTDPAEIQPAAYGIGYAHAEALKSRGVTPNFLICFSASEILMSAISGALSFKDGAVVARRRGLLQREIPGGGVAVIYRRPLHLRNLKRAVHGLDGIHFAGKITPLQSTLGYRTGKRGKLETALRNVEGVRRVIDIPGLNFPMHGPDMGKVREGLAELFESGIGFKDAVIPHIATRTARLNTKAQTIMHNIIWQTDNPINLEAGIMKSIRLNVGDYYDLGPGETMADLLRYFPLAGTVRINPIKI